MLYDSIDELPILRFHAYNKMLLIDAGVGSDLNDWDAHIEKAIRFIRKEKPDLAKKRWIICGKTFISSNPPYRQKYLAFACWLSPWTGTEYNDMTADGLQKVLDLFADAPNAELTAQLEAVQKKIDGERIAIVFS